jgi:hypothetical protein
MKTCEPSAQLDLLPMESPSMSSAEASRARTYPAPGPSSVDWTAHVRGYGQKSPAWFARFDRESFSWRTSQTCWLSGLTEFSQTWPRSGMTRNGIAYELPVLDCLTAVTAFGLLPTPTASDFKGGHHSGRFSELKHYLLQKFRMKYPPLSLLTDMMGFPEGWCELNTHQKP